MARLVIIKMKKRFCDFCGADITNDEIYSFGLYDELLEKEVFDKDSCDKCAKKIKKLIKDLGRKNE